MLDPLILRIIAVGFALLFLLASSHKLSNKMQFHGILAAYQILPASMLGPVAVVIPLLELVLGVAWCLTALMSIQIEFVPMLSAMLLTGYGIVIAVNLKRGRSYIDCGCGFSSATGGAQNASDAGGTQQLSSALVFRNFVLALVALWATTPISARDLGLIDFLNLALAIITLVFLYAAFNQLLINNSAIGAWRNSIKGHAHD
ncbi:MAG: hypothetical protein COA96_14625 [SAR86 cluster bacterium]|uniref:Methylamine utilization protein MauE n=1 Tax=SAR86 cluster bacterium TaxID=2030880 RepID=A0A2A5ATE7_9GAMM|nr:MAG: hypothetical protein COA96_14625 [SAR86 cluster bacterium]